MEANNSKEVLIYKVLLLGNSTVGKTSFLIRFADNVFDPELLSTVGVDYKQKYLLRNGKKIRLHICDTAGQERFRAIAKSFYKNVDGIVLMYDITQKKTFTDIKTWIEGIKENADIDKIGLVISGNKVDLESMREVNEEMRSKLEAKQNTKVFETSAKDNINVNEVFVELISKMEELNLGTLQKNIDDEESIQKSSTKISRRQSEAKIKLKCCGKSQ